MTTSGAPSDKAVVDWKRYAEDARALFLATSGAVPTAMRVWTVAWCEWMTSAAETQGQLARRWNSIVRDPGRGATVLNEMRQDVKDYLVGVAGIPERAVLEFLSSVSESAGSGGSGGSAVGPDHAAEPPPDDAFLDAVDNVVATMTDLFNRIETVSEVWAAKGGSATWPASVSPEYLAVLWKQLTVLSAARAKLKRDAP